MASSTQSGGATAAPPSTPSSHTNNHFSTPDADDLLSQLLHRLPPTLSLPTRRSPSAASAPPTISFRNSFDDAIVSQLGYFQLVDHPIPSQLARSAESDSVSLFNLTRERKRVVFPSNWPIGFDCDEDDDENNSVISESFCVDASAAEAATELDLSSLAELTREMEKIGLEAIELMSRAAGFENPTRDDPSKIGSLMWVSAEDNSSQDQVNMRRVYPYAVGLTYQLRSQQMYSLLGDSGWVTVSPQVDSVLVTVGDIAQVWSNGIFRKVRGRPVPNVGGSSSGSSSSSNNNNEQKSSSCITMTLLMTLRAESIVHPLVDPKAKLIEESKKTEETEASTSNHTSTENLLFKPFPFEDYAWRVYNERIILKDPLDRYRI